MEESFHDDDKQHVLQIVKEVEAAFDAIHDADWLSPDTRTLALAKLHAVTNRVGYPERWRDYSTLNTARDNWARTSFAAVSMNWLDNWTTLASHPIAMNGG